MSKFKVGDIVRRKKEYTVKNSPRDALNGNPVLINYMEEAHGTVYLSLNDGLWPEWDEGCYELVEPSQEYSTLTVEKALAFLMQEGYTVSISKK